MLIIIEALENIKFDANNLIKVYADYNDKIDTNMSFGDNIRRIRKESNMTQEQLAELLNISPQAVSRWETNTAMPDISLLPALANTFQISIDALLDVASIFHTSQRYYRIICDLGICGNAHSTGFLAGLAILLGSLSP